MFNHEYDKITDRIGRDKVLIPINHNYSKICDILGFFKLKTQEIARAFLLVMKKKSHLSACGMAIQSNYRHDTYCLISTEIRTVGSQLDLRILF